MGWLVLLIVLGVMIYLIVDTSQHKKRLKQSGGIKTKYNELIYSLSSIGLEQIAGADLKSEILLTDSSYCEVSIAINTTFKYSLVTDEPQTGIQLKNSIWLENPDDIFKISDPPKNIDHFVIKENSSGTINIEWKNTYTPQKTFLNMFPDVDPLVLKSNWHFPKSIDSLEILNVVTTDINRLSEKKDMYLRESKLLDEKNIGLRKINSNYLFSNFFTETEKLSVIRLAWLLAGINSELYDKAQQPIQTIYQLLNLPFRSEVFQKSRNLSSEIACANLKNHSEIDWILVSLNSVLMADGKQSKDKEQLLSRYLMQLNVSSRDFYNLIDKSNSILNNLKI